MATTYTTLLKIAKPTQGELDGSWGTVVNDNITSMIEEAIAGRSVINTWSGNSATLSTANGTTAESRSAMLSLTDTGTNLSGAATVICPTLSKIYIVKNGAGQVATLKTASGTGIAVPNGTTMFLFCDGTNVVEAISNVTGAFTASAAITASGVITGLTVEATGDTAAGDNAAMGYTSAEGLILTGQGSTNDVTIKNDADADVITIATGATNVDIVGDVTASTVNADGDTAAGDNATMGYTSAEGLILTGQGSTSDITLKNDADETVFSVPTGTDDILFPDGAKAIFGTSSDLQVYHDSSNSYLQDSGTGLLVVLSNHFRVNNAANSEVMFQATEDAGCDLYHNNVTKLATTANGATVTGTLIATTDTDTSNTGSVTLDFAANQNFVLTFTGNVTLANPSTEQVGQSGIICCIQDGTGSRTLSLGTDYETAGGSGITLSTAASAVDIIPYFVSASAKIQLGAVQLAFS